MPVDPSPLEEAVGLYRGEFLAGFQVPRAALFEEWVTVQRQQMHLTAVEALQRLVNFHLDAGSYEAGITHACRLLILDSWREETHRNLMLLLLLNGQHNAALKQYDQCRQILADELGVDPSGETQTLYQNIRKQIEGQDTANKIHLVPDAMFQTGPVPHNIPGQVTPFIGRQKEQRAIEIVLSDQSARLITIIGVGGMGKTRLALAVGEKQIHALERDGGFRFADGVFFVPLEAVESPTEIVPALCQALGFQPADEGRAGRSIEGQLLDYLRRKRVLLIIDNFEQLLDGVGLLAKIHRSTADVHMLVTSRQKLGLQGERLYALQGLRCPKASEQVINSERLVANYAAAALFAASARRVKPDFQLHDEDVSALIRLCRLVDGLPLAVELAAGWTNVLSLDDIVTEIEQGLSFLESDLHDLPDRHRNMEAVFDVSWRRLTKAEQAVFAQLCIFRGGFTRQAAAQVVGATLRQLAALVNKTLIQYDRKLDRYQVHRLLRQFGADKLAHGPAAENIIREQHCSYYSAALQQWDNQLKGAGQLEALAEFEKESANVRSAWYFAAETGQFAELDRAADGLGRLYLWRRRFHEGETAGCLAEGSLLQALSAKEARKDAAEMKRILAKIQIWQSVFCDRAKADELIGQALEVLNNPELAPVDTRHEQAFGLQRAGDLAFNNDGIKARRLYRRSLALYRELDDTWGTAKVLTALGWMAAHNGEMEEARQLGEEALVLVRASRDRKRTADALWLLGTLAILQGQVEESSRLLGESLDIRKTLGDLITDIASGPLDLGMTLTWIGRMAEADAVREEALALYEEQGQPEQIALAHVRLATSKVHTGQLEAVERHARIGLHVASGEFGHLS
jgi:predicted ATPase